MLPPIEVNQHNELIDGWHRWTAHKKRAAAEIRVKITPTQSDGELLQLAIERNASHGLQLSQADKRDMARKIYGITPERKRDAKKAVLARILLVSERTVREWLSRIDKDSKEAHDRRIFDMWMACHTQDGISKREDLSQYAVSLILRETADLPNSLGRSNRRPCHRLQADNLEYRKTQERSERGNHPANTEVLWLDMLL